MFWLLSFIALIVSAGAKDTRHGRRTWKGKTFSAKGRRSRR